VRSRLFRARVALRELLASSREKKAETPIFLRGEERA
jgi:hypothetical protein